MTMASTVNTARLRALAAYCEEASARQRWIGEQLRLLIGDRPQAQYRPCPLCSRPVPVPPAVACAECAGSGDHELEAER